MTEIERQTVESWAWPAALAATVLVGTFSASCLFPFTALAVLLAATMPGARAAAALLAVWAAEQVIGYCALGFPTTAFSILSGVGLLASALAALGVARAVLSYRAPTPLWLLAAWALAFSVYQLTLYAGAALLGPTDSFATPYVLLALRTDLAWLAGLAAFHAVLRRLAPRWFAVA